MKKTLTTVLAAVAIALLAYFILNADTRPQAAQRFSGAVREFSSQSAQLNDSVLQYRYGLMAHCDAINATIKSMRQLSREMQKPALFASTTGQAQIQRLVEQQEKQVEQVETRLSDLTATTALLNNSLRYFPVAIEQLLRQARLRNNPAVLAAASRLSQHLMAFNAFGNAGNRIAQIRDSVEELEQAAAQAPEFDEAVQGIRSHTQVILQNWPTVNAALRDLLNSGLAATISALSDIVALEQLQAEQNVAQQRRILVVVCGGLTACVLLGVQTLRRSRDLISGMNETLEQRVAARTQELSRANANLHAEIEERRRIQSELRNAGEELRRTQSQLQHVQKLESVGQRTTSVAHEISVSRNPASTAWEPCPAPAPI